MNKHHYAIRTNWYGEVTTIYRWATSKQQARLAMVRYLAKVYGRSMIAIDQYLRDGDRCKVWEVNE